MALYKFDYYYWTVTLICILSVCSYRSCHCLSCWLLDVAK